MPLSDDDLLDGFEIHLKREHIQGGGVFVVVLADEGLERAEAVADSISNLLIGRKRASGVRIVEHSQGANRGELLRQAVSEADQPLILITSGRAAWTAEHLDPMLSAIDRCDHAFGRRAMDTPARIGRWLRSGPWRWLFAVPLVDVHSPLRLHRKDRLAAIPFQSASDFLDIEIPAKATFLGHLIDEVDVPELDSPKPRVSFRDLSLVFKHPTFLLNPSVPAEDPQGEDEGHDRPSREDQHGGGDLKERGPIQDDGTERVEQLRQG